MKTLIKNGYLLTMEDETIRENGYVVVQDEKILCTGCGDAPQDSYDKVIDADEAIILPGFINVHTHTAMGLFRGYADDLPLMEWLTTKIFPIEEQLTNEYTYHGAMLDILEMIQSGTTCFLTMYMLNFGIAKAALESGIRSIVGWSTSGSKPMDKEMKVMDGIRKLFREYDGAGNGRVRVWTAPHACYTCDPEHLKRMADLTGELKTGTTIHLSETQSEVNGCVERYGMRPPAYFEQSGLYDYPLVAAHCIWLNDDEIAMLKKYHIGVAYNPESNMKLGSGIAPVMKLREAGVPVGLGTDGSSSNNDLNMIGEMRTAAFLQKAASLDPVALTAWDVLRMATVEGAKVLHMENEIGQLKPGYQADIILVDTKKPHMRPRHNVVSNLVYSADKSDVKTVMVQGKILMEDWKMTTLNEEEIIKNAEWTFAQMEAKLQQGNGGDAQGEGMQMTK